jgi:hypothetical protein
LLEVVSARDTAFFSASLCVVMPTIGGNTIKASVGMNAAETRYQKLKGIEDSKEPHSGYRPLQSHTLCWR